jgi:hypothetical protein
VHELALISKLTHVVVVSVGVLALEEHLADEVERMGTAADAAVGSVKVHLRRNRSDSRVVIACVIKHKVSDCTGVNTELLQRLADNISHLLAAMSTR